MRRWIALGSLWLGIALTLFVRAAKSQEVEELLPSILPGSMRAGAGHDQPGSFSGRGWQCDRESARAQASRCWAAGRARRFRGCPSRSPGQAVGSRSPAPGGSLRRRACRSPIFPLYGSLAIPDGAEVEGPPDGLTLDAAIERLVQRKPGSPRPVPRDPQGRGRHPHGRPLRQPPALLRRPAGPLRQLLQPDRGRSDPV